MNHISEESLNEYLDGRLSLEAREELEAHFSDCSFCQDQLAEMRQVFSALAEIREENPNRSVTSAVLAQIKKARLPLALRLALSVLAGVALGLLFLFTSLGWQLLKASDQLGMPLLNKLNTIDLHFFQNNIHGPASKFVGVPLPAYGLGISVLVFVIMLALGNLSLLKQKDRE